MAARVQVLARLIVDQYDGDAPGCVGGRKSRVQEPSAEGVAALTGVG